MEQEDRLVNHLLSLMGQNDTPKKQTLPAPFNPLPAALQPPGSVAFSASEWTGTKLYSRAKSQRKVIYTFRIKCNVHFRLAKLKQSRTTATVVVEVIWLRSHTIEWLRVFRGRQIWVHV